MAKGSYLARIASRVTSRGPSVAPPAGYGRATDAAPELPAAPARPHRPAAVSEPTITPPARTLDQPVVVPMQPVQRHREPPPTDMAPIRERDGRAPAEIVTVSREVIVERSALHVPPVREAPELAPPQPAPSSMTAAQADQGARDRQPAPVVASTITPPAPLRAPRVAPSPEALALMKAIEWTSSEEPPRPREKAPTIVPAVEAPRKNAIETPEPRPAPLHATPVPRATLEPAPSRRSTDGHTAKASERERTLRIGSVHVEIVPPTESPRPAAPPAPAKPTASPLARGLTSPLGLRQG